MKTAAERTYRMELQYDGTGLHGWAKQDGLATVEGSLETALRVVIGHSPALRVAGRTDAGVHARRQVVSLALPGRIEPRRLAASINALTPQGISVMRLSRAAPDFDARRDALTRTYRYFLCVGPVVPPFWAPYCWRVSGPLNTAAMQEAALLVRGRHDFTAFTPTITKHTFFQRRVVDCSWKRDSGRGNQAGIWRMEIEAETFLRHMVRALVGAMVEIGQGKREVGCIGPLLAGASRSDAGRSAPAQGLFLWDVKYPPRRKT